VRQFYIPVLTCLPGASVHGNPPSSSLPEVPETCGSRQLLLGQRMLQDGAVPFWGVLLLGRAFGEDVSDGLEELVAHRWFENVRFASHLLLVFHFNNSQLRERAAGHGFTGGLFLPEKKRTE